MVQASAVASRRSAARLPAWSRIQQSGQPADALLKRLKTLRQELPKAEQAGPIEELLDHLRPQLLHDDLIFHKSKEVRLATACCLAELLRLYAPDCPFDDDELLAVFTFFLAVLTSSNGGLVKSKGPQLSECVDLLQNLVTMRAFALLCDRGISEKPMIDYTKSFFNLLKPDTPKNVEILLAESLTIFVQHSNTVTKEFVELLMANFHPKVQKMNPAATHLAELIGNAAADDLQSGVAQHFADATATALQIVDEEKRASSLYTAHLVISQAHKFAPALLGNVVPLLEEELRTEDATIRLVAVRTLGYIFASSHSHAHSSVQKYPNAWKAWLGRSWDKSNTVRIAWVESLRGMMSQRSRLDEELMRHVELKLIDNDEKVRLAVVNIFASLDYTTLRNAVPRSILQTLSERVKDKKHSVRVAALSALGRTFDLAFVDLENGDLDAREAFSWIPSAICEALSHDDAKGLFVAVQTCLEQYILPSPQNGQEISESSWTSRFLYVLETLQEENVNHLLCLCNLQGAPIHLYVRGFVQACKQYNGGVVEEAKVESVRQTVLRYIGLLADQFADPLKAGHDLHAFAKQNDARTYRLIDALMDAKTDLKTSVKLRGQLAKKLSSERYAGVLEAVVLLAGLPFVNTSSIPVLFGELKESKSKNSSESKRTERILRVLKTISVSRIEMLLPHIGELKESLSESSVVSAYRTASLMILTRVEARSIETSGADLDEVSISHLQRIILDRRSAEEIKWASKLLSIAASNVSTSVYASAFQAAEEICQEFANNLPLDDSNKLIVTVTGLRQFVKHARETLGDLGDQITETLVKEILTKPLTQQCRRDSKDKDDSEDELDWLDDSEISDDLDLRLVSLRFVTERCLAYADHDQIETIATPVLRLLVTCMTQGESMPGLCGNFMAAKSRIRYEASIRLIKLSRKSSCDKLISVTDFQLLSQSFQDVVWQLRNLLLQKHLRYVMRRTSHLPARFYVLSFMVAFDPEEENRKMVQDACKRLLAVMKPDRRLRYFDIGLARLIHLLNHHPDFKDAVSTKEGFSLPSLAEVSRYFEFYLDCCATPDNLSCLNYIANRCKGMRDVFDEERRPIAEDGGIATEGIRTLSDLCICLIRRKAESMGCVVGDWKGQVALPRDLFLPYANREEQAKVLKRSYLTNEAIDLFTQPTRRERATTSSNSKRKHVLPLDRTTAKRSKPSALEKKSATSKTRKQRSKQTDGSDSEEDNDDEYESSSDLEDDNSVEASSDRPISDDEAVETSEDEQTAGRGVRTRRRLRQEKRLRNEGRRQRREARGKGVSTEKAK